MDPHDLPDEAHLLDRARGWARAWGWSRAVLGALVVGGALALAALLSQAIEPECRDLPREDLSLQELGQVRRLVDRYKADPEVPLALTPRQTSFLLREEFELPVWVNVVQGELTLESRVPRWGRCWSVSFDGQMEVDDAVAIVRPSHVAVGHLSLDPVASWVAWTVVPAQLQLPRARELLGHIRRARVDGDRVLVQVDDPAWLR